jgi:hypothetical protein
MTNSFTIIIAGIKLAITCNHSRLCNLLGQRYKTFMTQLNAEFNILVTWKRTGQTGDFIPPVYSFTNNGIHLARPGYTGFIDLTSHRADLEISLSTPVEAVDYFLRVVYALLIFEASGIMMHGAGILHKGKGYLFFGQSGSGKTTVSKASVDDIVLNDDLVVILPQDHDWMMYATPFWNPTQVVPKPIGAPLSAMYRLVQDKSVFIAPFKPGQALAEIMANIPIISSDTHLGNLLLDRCMILLRDVPTYKLHFLPDNTFWQTIDMQQKDL